MALYQTLELMLDGDLQNNFTDLFKLESTIKFECAQNQHQSEQIVVDRNGNPI